MLGPITTRSHGILTTIMTVLLGLMILVAVTNTNIPLFLVFNRLSHYTGAGLWANLTSLGEGLMVLSLAGLIAIRWPKTAWTILVAAVLGTLLVHGIKEAVSALRPAMILPADSFTVIGPRLNVVSFPSGHTTTITAFATILYLHAKNLRIGWLLLPLVLLVGLSRMAVGAHWPMDVMGGWEIGILIAMLSHFLSDRWQLGTRTGVQFGIVLLSIGCAVGLFWIEPQMQQALVLRWIFGGVGLASGFSALLVVFRRARSGLPPVSST